MEEIIERKANIKGTTKSWFKERLSRFKPVVFIKKNLPIFIFIILFLLSLLFRIWDIKKYEIYDISGTPADTGVSKLVSDYLDKNVLGKNFFFINSVSLSDELARNISYINYVNISKLVPNRLVIMLDLFSPKFVALIGTEKCSLLSLEGIVLEELCLESEDITNCCTEYVKDTSYSFFKSEEMDFADITSGKRSLLVIDTISKMIKIVESFGVSIKEVYLEQNIIDIIDEEGRVSRFSLSDNLTTQLARYFVVMRKIRQDEMKYSIIDVRFERPVVKN
ncbi:MAG TPA: hypothetical protein PLG10_00305 [Candidatus Dojkabacteria bacterium]|nr:hypothetical protein [Candidatus Dojkabacteria bacterium]